MSVDITSAIDARIREIVREELAAQRGDGITHYRTSGPLPPRISRKRFNTICRTGAIAGATHDGRDWVVAASSWFAARRTESTPRNPPTTAPANDSPTPISEEAIDRMISDAGYRLTRRAR